MDSDTLEATCQQAGYVGIDLRVVRNTAIPPKSKATKGLGVRVRLHSQHDQQDLPWFLIARSSITSTHLMLQKSVGLIDPGYRGEVKAVLYNTSDDTYHVQRGQRLLQGV